MLDSSLAGHLRLMATPDILITPSDLAPFAKAVSMKVPNISLPSASDCLAVPQQPQTTAKSSPAAAHNQALTGSPISAQQHANSRSSSTANVAEANRSVACINPGRAARGYHARIIIGLGSQDAGQEPADGSAGAAGCRVEIMKAC